MLQCLCAGYTVILIRDVVFSIEVNTFEIATQKTFHPCFAATKYVLHGRVLHSACGGKVETL